MIKKNKQYIIYWATTIAGKYTADAGVENGYNHRIYYTTTADFKNYSPTKLLYDNGFNVIDASIVPDGIVYFDKYMDHKYGAVTSTDLLNWADISDKITMPAGIRHGTVFTITRKDLTALLNHQPEKL